ncbi:MAG TPA: four helix bundle protein [Candidatus Synoicihabitans sp.]|nr:four helix bundle protein [Candidatus Synoicihabitans sp.]
MNDDTFENLEVWQDAIALGELVYTMFRGCGDVSFRQQVLSAAASVSNNIAEGYERDSNQEFLRFLIIAKGSCGKVRSQAYLALRVGLLNEPNAENLIASAKRLSKRLARYIQVHREDFGSNGSSSSAPCSMLPSPIR